MMGTKAVARDLPLRLIPGMFILNSGLGKRNADAGTAGYLHGEAARAYPFLKDMDPQAFTRLLSAGEIGVGAALLLPFVPGRVAGAVLAGFSVSLLGLYFTNPEARQDDGIRPTPQGIPLAKDSWLLAVGLALLAGSDSTEKGRKARTCGARKRRGC